jgi:hypothetical protein
MGVNRPSVAGEDDVIDFVPVVALDHAVNAGQRDGAFAIVEGGAAGAAPGLRHAAVEQEVVNARLMEVT